MPSDISTLIAIALVGYNVAKFLNVQFAKQKKRSGEYKNLIDGLKEVVQNVRAVK